MWIGVYWSYLTLLTHISGVGPALMFSAFVNLYNIHLHHYLLPTHLESQCFQQRYQKPVIKIFTIRCYIFSRLINCHSDTDVQIQHSIQNGCLYKNILRFAERNYNTIAK